MKLRMQLISVCLLQYDKQLLNICSYHQISNGFGQARDVVFVVAAVVVDVAIAQFNICTETTSENSKDSNIFGCSFVLAIVLAVF